MSTEKNENEAEKEIFDFTKMYKAVLERSEVPNIEIPFAVQDVISRIEQAQLQRAREYLNMQLADIMQNVKRIINRYTADENMHAGRKISLIEHKKRRGSLLEKIVACAKTAEIKDKTLAYILAWLEEWNVTLSEITAIDIEEHHHCLAQMEMLPETFKAIENNVKILSRISMFLLEEKKKQKKKTASRSSLWKSWKERVIKRPATAHALRPDQMISDQFATKTKVSEIQDMLQELIGTAMFNKLENNAIKYISSTTVNLSKALSTLNDEVKAINLHTSDMYTSETVEREQEISLKIIQDLSKRNEMLQQKLREAEEKYEHLIRSKVAEQQALPTSTQKVLPEPSPQSAMSQADTENSLDSILAKEFENMVDEAPKKGTKGLGIKWDSTHLYAAQGETTPDLTGQQKKSSGEITEDMVSVKKGGAFQKDGADEFQSQKKKHTKGPSGQETSESNVNDNKGKQKVTGTKLDHHLELQALDKKRKETKSFPETKSKSLTESKSQHFPSDFPSDKSQGGKSGTSGILEQRREAKSEHSRSKSQTSTENKEELTTESMDRDSRNEMSSTPEPSRLSKLDHSSEKIKGKKHRISPGSPTGKEEKSEEKDVSVFTKKFKSLELAKSGIPDGESEQSNLEEFQKAVVSFLKEKTDNIGKPLDKKTVSKEELLLKRSEVEKLGIIKAKMEEYFQKVAETLTKILRKYKDIKNEGRIGEKALKQKKAVSFMPERHSQEPTSAKSEISTLISQERLDPLTDNLIRMILTEIESERNVPEASTVGTDSKEKEKQELEKRRFEMINKNLEKEEAWLPVKEGKQGQQKEKQWQEEEVWKGQQKHEIQKQIESDEKQKQRQEEREGYQKSKQQQLEAWKQKTKQQGVPLEEEKGQQTMQVQKEVRHLEQESSLEREKKQKARRKVGDYESQKQKTAKEMKTYEQLEEVLSQTSITLSHRWESTQKDTPQTHQRKDFIGNLKKLGDLAEGKHPIPITTPISTQSSSRGPSSVPGASLAKSITLTSRLAQAMEIDLASEEAEALETMDSFNQVQALGETITPKMPRGLGVALSAEQAQALGIPITPQQAQAQGIMLTPQQVKALGVTLTPEQAQAPGITLTPQQAQALGIVFTPEEAQAPGITLTPQQVLALGIPITPQQIQEVGVSLTPQQAQALGITLTPEQAQAPGITLTPQQAQALGIPVTLQQIQEVGASLTPQQAQALGIPVTPQQIQKVGVSLTPQQAQALGIILTPEQAQAPGITLTPRQVQALGVPVTPQQVQAQGINLTPQQAQALGISVTPQHIPDVGASLTPQQAQALGIPITQQAEAQGITLTPQQAQALGITLAPEQAQAPGITLTPQQAQALGITLTPEQAQPPGITLTPQQAQALGITLTPEQAQAPGITLTPQQAQVLGITLAPEQAQPPGITLTPQQAQALGITLAPEQAQAPGITLTPQQAQALGITLAPEQAQAPGITLTPQQAQALGITLTPEQAQAPGITLTPQQAQALGITLAPEQAQVPGITLTPQQAQALGITLAPEQAQAPGITLTPQQAQALGITLTPEQAQAPGITLTLQQAQALGITLAPEQAQAPGITLTLQQAQALGITLAPEQTQAPGITLTPQQARTLGITLAPEQAQAPGITLTPQQAQALGITLAPEQAQVPGITLTPQQAQALGITLAPEQAQAPGITLTPQQAQALGITLTPEQAQAPGITLTPQQAQALGITLAPEQAQAPGITLTPQQAQALGIPITPQQAEAQGLTLTPQQTQDLGIPATPQGIVFTPQQAQALGIHITPEQAQAQDITLTPQQSQALRIPVTIPQAQDLGAPFTLGQAQALGVSLSHEQFAELGVPLTSDKVYTLEYPHIPEQIQPVEAPLTPGEAWSLGITVRSVQDLTSRTPLIKEQPLPPWARPPSVHTLKTGISSITDKSVTKHAPHISKESPVSSAATAEKSPIFEVPSTPLHISRFPLKQAPSEKFLGMRIPSDPGKPLAPQISPSSRQTPVSKDLSTSVPFPTPVPSPISGLSPTPQQPLEPEALLSSRRFFISRDSMAPQSPLIQKPLLDLRQPLMSGVPVTFAQIPQIWAPLSPGKHLVPGTSSIPQELLKSRPLTLSEKFQASQTFATRKQSPGLQAPSTLRQHLPPGTLPGHASPLWVSPTPGRPLTPLTPSTPEKPQKGLSSAVSEKRKKRLSIISSLKLKSVSVHPSAPSFKVIQAPFTTKKFQTAEVSDTSEEIQIPKDPFAVKQFRMFKSHLTDYKTPVSQAPYVDEGTLPATLIKPVTPLPSLITTQLLKTRQSSPSEWDQKSQLPPINKPWVLTSVSDTKQPKMMVPTSYPQELKEQNYFVDVEAQRKNLILLNQATKSSILPSQLHTEARNLIIETFHTDKVRLGYLFRKYNAYRLIQRARNNIIKRLQAIQITGRSYETQNLYIMLKRIDDYQKKIMQIWTEKQNSLEQKRNQCLRKMMYLFSQLQETYKLNLDQPIPLVIEKKQKPASTKSVQQPCPKLLKEDNRKYNILNKFRKDDQLQAIWNADLSTSSYPITEKTSMHPFWAQLGGYPDIPMLLQLDVQSAFIRSLTCIQSRFKKIPR
ncbi:protein FAM186A [Bos javanicus]|uniref:protein FAM186A n=1 Tax=Bos javanicus TaxID=9906 RepID=UPI002AA8A15F|nr:protein FAM186A [Bos javanicus]